MWEPVPEHKLLLHLTIHPKTLFLSRDTLHRGYRLRIGFLGFRGSQQFTECTHILSDIRAHDLAVLSRNAVRSQTDGIIVRIRFHVCAEEELNSIICSHESLLHAVLSQTLLWLSPDESFKWQGLHAALHVQSFRLYHDPRGIPAVTDALASSILVVERVLMTGLRCWRPIVTSP